MAIFRGQYAKLQIPHRFKAEQIIDGKKSIIDAERMLRFEKGAYETNDKDEINTLRDPKWKMMIYEVTEMHKKPEAKTEAPEKPVEDED